MLKSYGEIQKTVSLTTKTNFTVTLSSPRVTHGIKILELSIVKLLFLMT